MLNDSLAKILPSFVGLRVGRLSGSSIKDIGAAEVRAEELRNFWPSHKFMDGEEFEELGVKGNLLNTGVFVDAVEEVGLFVIIGGEDNVVDDSLQGLK